MKPQEILGMVEEAAGTRMYEEKKASSVKSMAKKAKKIAEIELIQKEEIVPKLEKLKREKDAYLAYTKAESELQRTARLVKAWDWSEAKRRVDAKQNEIDANLLKAEKLKEENKERAAESKQTQKQLDDAVKRRKREMEKGGKLTKYEQDLAEVDKELEKVKTQIEIKKREIKEEVASLEQSTSQLQQVCAFVVDHV
jgi:structural maintenance of chromosome 2